MSRSDYHFSGPPEGLSHLRSRLIVLGFAFVALLIIAGATLTSGMRPSAAGWLLMIVPLMVLFTGAVLTVRAIRERFPEARNPEGTDQKTLPPLPESREQPLLFPVHERKLRFTASPAVRLIPVVIIAVSAAAWLAQRSLLSIVSGTALVGLWFLVVAAKGGLSLAKGRLEHICIDHRSIRVPLFLLSDASKRLARRDHDRYLTLQWRNIVSWTVVSGDSEDPAIYQVRTRRSGRAREYEIHRSALKGREHELLDAVRATGQIAVVLNDSADY